LDEDDITSKYRKYLDENQMNTFKQNAFKEIPNSTDLQVRAADFPPTTLDLFFNRKKNLSILYNLDEETIEKLKESLKNKYPSFYDRLEPVDKFFYSKEPTM
jgi:predicted transcriptional regulator